MNTLIRIVCLVFVLSSMSLHASNEPIIAGGVAAAVTTAAMMASRGPIGQLLLGIMEQIFNCVGAPISPLAVLAAATFGLTYAGQKLAK